MSTITRSATVSSAQLFATVGAAATALTTGFTVIGDAADVLGVKSKDWLDDTRMRSQAMRIERMDAIVHDVALTIAQRKVEVKKILDRESDLREAYLAAQAVVLAAINTPSTP